MIKPYEPIPIEEIQDAKARIKGTAIRTPLVRLNVDDAPAEIYLKLENLQPIGSFKIRGAANAIRLADPKQIERGVWTTSAGNMAQALAWCARALGVACTVVVPDHVPLTKLRAIERFGAKPIKLPFSEMVQIAINRRYEGMEGLFIHPFSELAMMAGSGTIGLEIIEDLPDVDAVIIPWGGGGLCCGIASALRALKPEVKVYASEVETGAPLAPSLSAGKPVEVDHTYSFVDGISLSMVFPEMLQLSSQLVDGALVSTLEEVASSVRLIVERNHVVAEGAGATSVAAALSGKAGNGKVVCVVSGGNIDSGKLAKILQGQIP